MVQELSFNNFNVDEKGRVTVSGLASGIDTRSAIDSIITARRVPIDRIERAVVKNEDQIVELNKLRRLVSTLASKVSVLRGEISFKRDKDVFEAKGYSISQSRDDAGLPSPAPEVFGFGVTSKASIGSHRVEMLQAASSHKVSSLTSVAINGADALGIDGEFRLKLGDSGFVSTDKSIIIKGTDSVFDIRDAINAANRGDATVGVTASIVTVRSETDSTGGVRPVEVLLTLTADRTGQQIQFDHVNGDDVLGRLNVVNARGFTNVLKDPRAALIRLDGQIQGDAGFVSKGFANSAGVIGGGSLSIRTSTGGQSLNVTVPAGATLAQAVAALDGQAFSGSAVLRAEITTQGDGTSALSLLAEDGGSRIAIEIDGAGALAVGEIWRLGEFSRPPLVVERDSNTISDLIEGVTFNLFRAEPGTEYEIAVEYDRVAVKTGVVEFVESYNEVRRYLNGQREIDPRTGAPVDGAVLYGETILSTLESELSNLISIGVLGAEGDDFRGIGQETLGLSYTLLSASEIESGGERALSRGTLEVDEAALDQSLLNNLDRIRKLFTHTIRTDDSRLAVVGAATSVGQLGANGLTVTVVSDGAGAIDADATTISIGKFAVSGGNRIVVTEGPAAGLTLFYRGDLTGTTPVSVNIQNSLGVAHQISNSLNRILAERIGIIDTELEAIRDGSDRARVDIAIRLRELDLHRDLLVEKFGRLESTIAKFSALREQLLQVFSSGK